MNWMHNPGMIRKPVFAALLFFSCALASAAPPLRIAVPAGSLGLASARAWSALSNAFGSHDGTGLQPVLIQDDATALSMLQLRQADIAVLDTAAYLATMDTYELLGIIENYGRPLEAFVLIASMGSIIHRTDDLWRARLMLAGPPAAFSWVYPLAWVRSLRTASTPPGNTASEPLEADGYAGVLKGIALGTADAGFIPEGFFQGLADGMLAARVRIIETTEAYPLNLLVGRMDLSSDRKAAARHLQGLSVEGLGITAPEVRTLGILQELKLFLAQAEATGVTEP
jgi:ABC-type phosphate/phosphonate transport system substrate-binding protein